MCNAVSEKNQAITKLDNAVSEKLRAINQVLDSLLPGDTSMNIGSDYIPASSNVPEG